MKAILKEQYKNIILIIGYIFVACCVYVILFDKLWHNVLVDVFSCLGIIAVGVLIGWYYISVEHKKFIEKQEEANKVVENTAVEETTTEANN